MKYMILKEWMDIDTKKREKDYKFTNDIEDIRRETENYYNDMYKTELIIYTKRNKKWEKFNDIIKTKNGQKELRISHTLTEPLKIKYKVYWMRDNGNDKKDNEIPF